MSLAPTSARSPGRPALLAMVIFAPIAMVVGVVAGFITTLNQSFDGRLASGPLVAVLAVEFAVASLPAIVLLVLSIRRLGRHLFPVLSIIGVVFAGGSLLLASALSIPNLVRSSSDVIDFAVAQSRPLTPAETANTAEQLREQGDAFAIATGRAIDAAQVTTNNSVPAYIDDCPLSTRDVGKSVTSAGLFFSTDRSEKEVEQGIAADWAAAGLVVNYTDANAPRGESMVHASGKYFTNITATWTGLGAEYNVDIEYETICVSK